MRDITPYLHLWQDRTEWVTRAHWVDNKALPWLEQAWEKENRSDKIKSFEESMVCKENSKEKNSLEYGSVKVSNWIGRYVIEILKSKHKEYGS